MSEHEFRVRKVRLSNHRGKKKRRKTDCWVDAYTRVGKGGKIIHVKAHWRGKPPQDAHYLTDRIFAGLTAITRREDAAVTATNEMLGAIQALSEWNASPPQVARAEMSKAGGHERLYENVRRSIVASLRTLGELLDENDLREAGLMRIKH